eukprot:12413460-Karenia_brevis.AAC.1
MSNVERSPVSSKPRGVVRPASREPVPEPPRQVPRSQPTQQFNHFPPKPLPIPSDPPRPPSPSLR